jgi:type II secretory pathway component PulM
MGVLSPPTCAARAALAAARAAAARVTAMAEIAALAATAARELAAAADLTSVIRSSLVLLSCCSVAWKASASRSPQSASLSSKA